MITINPNFAGFKSFFKNLLTIYQREADTYKDINKEGLFERYMALFGEHIDSDMSSEIENFLNIIDAGVCDEKFLNPLSDVLGNPPDIFKDVEQYRNLLTYITSVYKVKGTTQGYKLFFYMFGFDVTVIETEPIIPNNIYDDGNLYDDSHIYEPETCPACSSYTISVNQINSNTPVNPSIIALLRDAITFNEPINAVLSNFTITTLLEDDMGEIIIVDLTTDNIVETDLSLQLDSITGVTMVDEVTETLTQEEHVPTINLQWNDTLNTVDKVCNTAGCPYVILFNYNDIDGDIVSVSLQESSDNGVTWLTTKVNMLPETNPNLFNIMILPDTDRQFRSIVTDSFNNMVTSNILRAYSTYVAPTETTNFYYEGIYDVDDPVHSAGTVVYIDANGDTQYSEFLWAGECRLIVAVSIISHVGAVTCIPDTEIPSTPTGLYIIGTTGGSVSLGWIASTDNTYVAGYEIQRSIDTTIEGGSPIIGTVEDELFGFTDYSLSVGHTYTYRVRAVDISGNYSEWSNEVYVEM